MKFASPYRRIESSEVPWHKLCKQITSNEREEVYHDFLMSRPLVQCFNLVDDIFDIRVAIPWDNRTDIPRDIRTDISRDISTDSGVYGSIYKSAYELGLNLNSLPRWPRPLSQP